VPKSTNEPGRIIAQSPYGVVTGYRTELAVLPYQRLWSLTVLIACTTNDGQASLNIKFG